MSDRSNKMLKGQVTTFVLLAIASCIFVIVFGYFLLRTDYSIVPSQQNTDLPIDKVDPQTILMNRIDGENQILNQRLKYLEESVLENKKKEEAKEGENSQLRQELARLKNELKEVAERPKETKSDPSISNSVKNDLTLVSARSLETKRQRYLITEVSLSNVKERVHHVDQTIPAGTTVQAMLVSSVDAPCGVYSSSDPQPVKLRILDNGHLPKAVEARLKGGLVIASVYGDLSNERVYMRLERLTQVKKDGTFVETAVTGFVTGEDGKYGLRGVVADKSIKLVENATLSGLCSGVSSYLSSLNRAKYYNVNETVAPSALDCGTEGGLKGACSAFDMLTNYFIRRAEQIRPVIQVTAGRMVDITFTHSTHLGDLYTKDQIKEIRNVSKDG